MINSPHHPRTAFEGLRTLLVASLVALMGMVGAGWAGVEIASDSRTGGAARSLVTGVIGHGDSSIERSVK